MKNLKKSLLKEAVFFNEKTIQQSTQDLLLEKCLDKALPENELWALQARNQENGRGQRGRKWQAAEGNLFLSLALRQEFFTNLNLPFLTLLAGKTLYDLLEQEINLPAGKKWLQKWPNDLLVLDLENQSFKKVAGIISEVKKSIVVLGLGLNVVHGPSGLDQATSSLLDEDQNSPDADSIAKNFNKAYIAQLNLWKQGAAVFEKQKTAEIMKTSMAELWGRKVMSLPSKKTFQLAGLGDGGTLLGQEAAGKDCFEVRESYIFIDT